jgi:DNA replication licensing factor MCM2
MAEASARMHLREHVREDDIDMAIKVVLSSFLQAQKVRVSTRWCRLYACMIYSFNDGVLKASVRRSLARCFRKYTTYGEESNQLLMHQLQSLTVDAEKYKLITKNTSPVTGV